MAKFILFLVCFQVATLCRAQGGLIVTDSLLQLHKSQSVLDTYTNFDVLKVMLGHGRASDAPFKQGAGLSLRGQFLWPYSISKNSLRIAYGLTFGYNKITALSAAYTFNGDHEAFISENKEIKSTMLRTGYIGPTVLRVTRLRSVTLLTGASLEYNLYSKLKVRTDKQNYAFSAKRYVHDFSFPLHVQVGISKKQFIAAGIWSSYDLRPRFRASNLNGLKQWTTGLSLSLII